MSDQIRIVTAMRMRWFQGLGKAGTIANE